MDSRERNSPFLSFVVPAFNEEPNIEPIASRIADSCRNAKISDYEILFVENGSTDRSADLIRRLHAGDSRIGMVQLSRNFGYQGSIAAGLAYAKGEWVAILDGDQQDPPELIPKFLEKAQAGFDVVYGVRRRRPEGILKRSAYKIFYRLWRWSAEIEVPVDASEFCVMNRKVVDTINRMPERQRFTRGLRAWVGFRQTGLLYDRGYRGAGSSKFTFFDMIDLALDGLLAYTIVPIRLMIVLGLLLTGFFVLVSFVNVIVWILNQFGIYSSVGLLPLGLTQINVTISLLLGFVILCLGLVGEYVGRVYEEVKQRPLFVVNDTLLDEAHPVSNSSGAVRSARAGPPTPVPSSTRSDGGTKR